MPGFLVSNIKSNYILKNIDDTLHYDEINNEKFVIQRLVTTKFLDDKVFFNDDENVVITEGVVLNKKQILEKTNFKIFSHALKKEWEENGTICHLLRAGWSSAIYDKKKNKWEIATNPFGDKTIFYYYDNNNKKFVVASSVRYIKEFLKHSGANLTLCKTSAYDLLTFGYNASDKGENTILSEVKKLPPGYMLTIQDEQLVVTQYHRFSFASENDDEKQCNKWVEELDDKYVNAVRNEYDKDEEYGYGHLCALSGGLDSRMNVWVANHLGYENILTETFCQSGTDDQKIANEIASDLHLEWIFKSLDDGKFLKTIEEAVISTDGLIEVSGIIHEDSLMQYINFDKFGILHTGQIGDAVLGGSLIGEKIEYYSKAYSTLLFDKYIPNIYEGYICQEEFLLYTRGLNGAIIPQILQSNYCEPVSPFMDLDFAETCFKIPVELRKKHKIYKKWILKKYSSAAKYNWEKTGVKIDSGKFYEILVKIRRLGFHNTLRSIMKKMGWKVSLKVSANNMNPYDYWYENNPELRTYLDNDFLVNIQYLKERSVFEGELSTLGEDICRLYYDGTCREKVQALSVVYIIKHFIIS